MKKRSTRFLSLLLSLLMLSIGFSGGNNDGTSGGLQL